MRMNSETLKFYTDDLEAHRGKVERLLACAASLLMVRGMDHDASKLGPEEAERYAPVVWQLNHDGPAYGTPEYHELVGTLGPALEHHRACNDHHPEFFGGEDPLAKMDLFQVLEMVCDWVAAASRHGGDPLAAMKQTGRKYPIDPQVKALLTNTVATLCGDGVALEWKGEVRGPVECIDCEFDSQCDGNNPQCPLRAEGGAPAPVSISKWAETRRVPCPTGPGLSCMGYDNCTRGALCQATPGGAQ